GDSRARAHPHGPGTGRGKRQPDRSRRAAQDAAAYVPGQGEGIRPAPEGPALIEPQFLRCRHRRSCGRAESAVWIDTAEGCSNGRNRLAIRTYLPYTEAIVRHAWISTGMMVSPLLVYVRA